MPSGTEWELKRSIDRAIRLLHTPADYGDYASWKISPVGGGCCCFHCWSETWNEVNEWIQPCGPLVDEGDVLVTRDGTSCVLECHESGPEVVVYVTAATASALLAKAVIELITTILKTRSGKTQRPSGKLVITKRTFSGQDYCEEQIVEVEVPVPSDLHQHITDEIERTLNPWK